MSTTRTCVLFAGVLAVTTGAIAATSAEYPVRPIRMLVPFTPGGGTDIIARALGTHLSGAFGQNVIIDNRPGGNTVIASDIVAKARPDGYTVIMQINTLTALPAMMKEGPGSISLAQFSPISLVAVLPHVLIVHRSVAATSVKDLVAIAKSSPGKLNYATPGSGTPVHLAGALFATMAGIDIVPVPYKGAAEYTAAILGNHVQMVFGSAPTAIPHIRTGAVKPLGVTTSKRIPALPDVPAIAETGFPGYEIVSWYGVLAPAKTPPEVVTKLAKEIAAATKTKAFADAVPDYQLIGNTPEAFSEFIRKDAEMSARIIAQSGAKAH